MRQNLHNQSMNDLATFEKDLRKIRREHAERDFQCAKLENA